MNKLKTSYGTIISLLLITSTVLMPFAFYPKKVEAQQVSAYASGIVPAILLMPQCQSLRNEISGLFSDAIGAVGNMFSSNGASRGTTTYTDPVTGEKKVVQNMDIDPKYKGSIPGSEKYFNSSGVAKSITDYKGSLDIKANESSSKAYSIQTSDETSQLYLKDISDSTAATNAQTKSLNENSTCIASIGRLIAKMLLQKLTVSTVNWINSGFDGSPSFVQDPGKFFGDIAKTEVLQFGGEINGISPYSKDWLRNTALAFNNKFQNNAQYSLDEVMKNDPNYVNAETFQMDFSRGGWDAWTEMAATPANNPMGFKIMADNELQRRLEGTVESTAQQIRENLTQASGFLGDMRCSADPSMTKSQRDNALRTTGKDSCIEAGGTWEYVTPGKMISDYATQAIGYQNNAYLNVQDLNDAVAALIDALLGQFSSNIIEKGFANIGDQGADGQLVIDDSYTAGDTRTRTEKDYTPAQLTGSSWLQANPNFNIRTDLTQALIDEQRTYSDKLALQNKELLSTIDGKQYAIDPATGISNTWGLVPAIYQLDYCIPGPHPGWENDSRMALAAGLKSIIPETTASTKDKKMSAVVGTAKSVLSLAAGGVGAVVLGPLAGTLLGLSAGSVMLPVVGTVVGAIVGAIVGFVISLFTGSDDAANVRAYYSTIIGGFLGYSPPSNNENDDRALNLESKSGLTYVLNSVLDRYSTIIKQIFTQDTLPPVATEAATIYEQLPGYIQMIKDNTDETSLLKNTINTLGDIKKAVDNLNDNLETKQITQDDYDTQIKTQINAFGRISASMVNGDDIAKADNILKQIKDKRAYVYDNLLKGPYGCEKELETPKNFPFPYKITDNTGGGLSGYGKMFSDGRWDKTNTAAIKRMTYPFPIIYDYNVFKKDSNIPDPWNSGFTNKVPNADANLVSGQPSFYDANGNLKMGPGFLSFIYFSAGGSGEADRDTYRGPERLKIHDLVPQSGVGQWVSVGERSTDHEGSSPFEHMIGIY